MGNTINYNIDISTTFKDFNHSAINTDNSLILSLPAEVLVKIFSLFTRLKDLNSLIRTCKLFKCIVYKYHAFDSSVEGKDKLLQIFNMPIKGFTKMNKEVFKGYMLGMILLIGTKGLNSSVNYDLAIQCAIKNGHVEAVTLLLADPRLTQCLINKAFRLACKNGHIEIVKLLLADSRVDPSDGNNIAIQLASLMGHAAVVELLLADARVDSRANNHKAIQWAREYGREEVVQLLERRK